MDDFQKNQIANPGNGRRTYLVACSQADLKKFPTRESFGAMLEAKFNAGPGKARVSHWACCLEEHQEGGFHYHVSLKLSAPKKWLMVKNTIAKEHNVTVHLSDNHDNYIAAYKYVCKTDNQVFHSVSHPDLSEIGPPKTKNSNKAHRDSRKRVRELNDKSPQRIAKKSVSSQEDYLTWTFLNS